MPIKIYVDPNVSGRFLIVWDREITPHGDPIYMVEHFHGDLRYTCWVDQWEIDGWDQTLTVYAREPR